jgi:hypothetical protein
MKKYVVLRLSLLLFLVSQLHAMEMIKQDPSISCDDVCYLNEIPREILDYIAGFLMETEEEFVERVCRENAEEQEEREKKLKEPVNDVGVIRMLIASNIDATKALLFYENACELTFYDYLDHDEGHINTQYVYKEERKIEYNSIALSPKGRIFACYHCKLCKCNELLCEELKYTLEIRKIDTQKKQDGNHILMLRESRELHHGESLGIDRIVFNNQGNQLIAYYSHNDFKPTIFSLKSIDATKPQVAVKATNKLQEYLRDAFVCNQYIEGKK